MDTTEDVCLIKFVAKKEYTVDLLKGHFYTNTSRFYHKHFVSKDYTQGDILEGNLARDVCGYTNLDLRIFSMCYIGQSSLKGAKTIIDQNIKRMIEGFNANYAVVIEAQSFYKMIAEDPFSVSVNGHKVVYRNIRLDEVPDIFNSKDGLRNTSNLFYKPPVYAYQREYRLVFGYEDRMALGKMFSLKDEYKFNAYMVDLEENKEYIEFHF